jgi:hypothetical protein
LVTVSLVSAFARGSYGDVQVAEGREKLSGESTMKTLLEVIADAQESESFDTILREAAKNAVTHGVGSTQWVQLMNYFAETPAELDELSNPYEIADSQMKLDAFRTTLTFTSAACPTTIFTGQETAEATATKSAKRQGRRSKPVAKAQQPLKPAKKTNR